MLYTPELCEVRIPTYKRGPLLHRAIQSLINQKHTNWLALVFDDSPEKEGEAVVESFNDSRLQYSSNPSNLGAAGNLNQCFQTEQYLAGKYAFVLEDDNYISETFISRNIEEIKKNGTNILLRNQKVEKFTSLDKIEETGLTAKGYWFENKVYSPLELHAFLFFMEGISNGGLFWNTKANSNLVVTETADVGIQENFRTFHIIEPIFFAAEPLATFSLMNKDLTARKNNKNRNYARGRQELKRILLKRYGRRIVKAVEEISLRKNLNLDFEETLLDSLYFRHNFKLNLLQRFKLITKSAVRYYFIKFN